MSLQHVSKFWPCFNLELLFPQPILCGKFWCWFFFLPSKKLDAFILASHRVARSVNIDSPTPQHVYVFSNAEDIRTGKNVDEGRPESIVHLDSPTKALLRGTPRFHLIGEREGFFFSFHSLNLLRSAVSSTFGKCPPLSVLIVLSYLGRNALSYIRCMMQNFLAFRDNQSYHPIKTLASHRRLLEPWTVSLFVSPSWCCSISIPSVTRSIQDAIAAGVRCPNVKKRTTRSSASGCRPDFSLANAVNRQKTAQSSLIVQQIPLERWAILSDENWPYMRDDLISGHLY